MGFIPGMQEFFSICKLTSVIHHINKLKNRNHTIISRDVEKAFDKVQHPFMIKTLQKVSTERTYLNIYDKPTAVIIVSGEKRKAFPLKSGTRQGCPLSALLVNKILEFLATETGEDRKEIQVGKVKLSQFADDMILHIEYLKDAIRKLLELISEFKVQRIQN